mgnify:CR=1 FL=1
MRKIFTSILLCCLTLCGCAKDTPESPEVTISGYSAETVSSDKLSTDLQSSLNEFHQSNFDCLLNILEISVLKSLTEEKTFTATIDVSAESQYAVFQYIADITYTKYDQGWAMDNCTWSLMEYTAIRYPDANGVLQLKQESGVAQQEEISLTFENGIINYRGKDIINWSPIANCSKEIELSWYYTPYNDWWTTPGIGWDSEGEKCTLSSTLEGTWQLGKGDMATISNVSDSGFDLEIKAAHYETDVFHVEVGNIYISDEGNSVQITFTSDVFNLRDPKYPSDFYGEMHGTAPISIYLYKEKQERLGQVYNMYINFMVMNNAGHGADVYGSDLYCLVE